MWIDRFVRATGGRVSPPAEKTESTGSASLIPPRPVRVLVMDASAAGRRSLADLLQRQGGVRVQSLAGPEGWDPLRRDFDPQVLVLTMGAAAGNGSRFLETLMDTDPLPVVLCGGDDEGDSVLRCLERGAVAALPSPSTGSGDDLSDVPTLLIGEIHRAAAASLSFDCFRKRTPIEALPRDLWRTGAKRSGSPVIVLAAGEGGTPALQEILKALPEDTPGVLVATRLPQSHTGAFARRLAGVCRMEVKEGVPNDVLRPGQILIAPGNRHALLAASAKAPHVEIVEGPLVGGHRPSFDVLFRSASLAAGARAVGVLLTGLGEDGVAGLAVLRAGGARTAAQEGSTCFAAELPRLAVESGAARDAVPLSKLPAWILENAVTCLETDPPR